MPELNELEVREFYSRWSSTVFTLSRLFLGEQEAAEEATQQGFVNYLGEVDRLEFKSIPLRLLRKTLEAARGNSSAVRQAFPDTDEMEDMIKLLPQDERAVFILRSVLDLGFSDVMVVTGLSSEQVNRLWSESILHVRDFWLKKTS
jgi:DNA-directed RNA polymerase specialized sigma24 family protein